MKQKNCNKILTICNVVILLLFISEYILGNVLESGIKISLSVFGIFEEYEIMIKTLKIAFTLLSILNLVCIVQNKKSKKIMLWYMVTMLGFVIMALTMWEIEINKYIMYVINWGFCIILPIVLAIRNIVITIKEKQNKKKIVLYSVIILFTITGFFIKWYMYIWMAIASVMQFIHNRKENNIEEHKMKKIINTILYGIILTILVIYIIVQYVLIIVNLYSIDRQSAEFINEIKTNLEIANVNEKDMLIRVCRDDKWGYINQNGEEVIPCEYEGIVGAVPDNYPFTMLYENNQYKVISKNGKLLATCEGRPAPWISDIILEQNRDKENEMELNLMTGIVQIYSMVIDQNMKAEVEEEYNPYYIIEPNNVDEYVINSNTEEYIIKVNKKIEKKEEIVLNINGANGSKLIKQYNDISYTVTSNNGEEKEIELNLISNDTYENALAVYSDGYIPYYNLDEKVQGYYDKDLNLITLQGNYQILDIKNDIMLIKEFDDAYETKRIIAMNIKTGEQQEYKHIETLEEGYVVKKNNDKIVLLDNSLKEKSKEYDEMALYYYEENYLLNSIYENKCEEGK